MIYTAFFWLQLGVAVLLAGLALYVLRFRDIPAAKPFATLMALTALVAVDYALDLSTDSLPLKVLWMNLRVTFSVFLPLGFLWLGLEYAGRGAWLTRRRVAVLLVVPILTVLLTWTGSYHSWYRYNFRVNLDAPFPLLIWDSGPMHWVVQWYMIAIEAGAIWALIRSLRIRALYAPNTLILILGILVPALANALFTVGVTPWRGFNPTSIAFIITGPILAWALLRLRLFEVVPVARSAALEAIGDLVFVLDRRDRLVDFNRAAQAAASLDHQAGGTWPDTLPAPWADLFRRYPDLSTGKEQVVLDCGEGPCAYDLTVSPVHDARGRALGRLFVLHDVTERRQAEEIIRLRLRLLEFADDHSLAELMQRALDEIGRITHSPIGFYHFVEADQKTLWLQAWSTRTLEEFCTAEGAGLHYDLDRAGVWVDCVYQRRPVIHNDYAVLPHRKGMPPGHAGVTRELVVPTMREGQIVSVLGVGNKLSEYDDQDVALVSYVADIVWAIVERKQAQEALSQYAEQLAVRNAELDAFAHTVAHDLQNPLSIVIGFARFLVDDLDGMSPSEMAKAAYHILRSGQKLNRIIEDLMLLAGIRQQEITPEPLDMGAVVREALDQLQPLIQERQAQVTVLDSDAWPAALGYAPWIEHVWDNYISNAIKYSGQPPQVQIGADREGSNGLSDGGMARFWVQDNGAGLDAEAQASLFMPFTRLDQAHIQGHGLGLSIVRRIVEKLGGQVGVESQPGQGSRFFFTLPLGRTET